MDKIGFNIFNYSHNHLQNSFKPKGGTGAAEPGFTNNSLEDKAVFSEDLKKSIEKIVEEDTAAFSLSANNAPTFDFRNMSLAEFEEATMHMLSEGKISMDERISLMLNAGIFRLYIDPKTGSLTTVPPGKSLDSPFKYGSSLDSQTKYNFIEQTEQYIQFRRENGYLIGLKNTESALEKLLALSV